MKVVANDKYEPSTLDIGGLLKSNTSCMEVGSGENLGSSRE